MKVLNLARILLQNMVYSTIQHPPPQSHTLSVYTVYILWGGGGGSERRKRGNSKQVLFLRPWGQQFTSWVEPLSEYISSL